MRLHRIHLLFLCFLCCMTFVLPGIAEGIARIPADTLGEGSGLTAARPEDMLVLSPGWNFVSIPRTLAPGSATAFELFKGVDLSGRSIFGWDGARGRWYVVMPEEVLKPLEGLWVYSVTREQVPLVYDTAGVPFPPSRQLYRGWNAVGGGGTTPLSARDTLISLGTAWEVVVGYQEGTTPDEPIRRGSTDPRESESRLMVPFQGYWVFLNEDRMYLGML